MAQWLARGAHNSEVTRSKRVAGIHHSPSLQKLVVKMDAKRIKSGVNLLSSRWTQNVSKERCETRSPSSWRRFKRNKSDVTPIDTGCVGIYHSQLYQNCLAVTTATLRRHGAAVSARGS